MRTFIHNLYHKFNAIMIDDVVRKTIFLRFVCMTGIVFLIPMGMMAHLHYHRLLWLTDWGIALFLVANLFYLKNTGRLNYVTISGTSFVAVLFLWLLTTGGLNNSGFVWSFAFPLISLFLLGPVRGSLANLLFFIPMVLFLVIEPRIFNFTTYPADLKLRLICAFAVVSLYSLVFVYGRNASHTHLQDQNSELERLVAELTATKADLLKVKATLEQRVQERTRELQEQVEARQLGGRLSAHSDGPGTGATFTLELPVTPGDRP